MNKPIMAKATAVWLVDNTTLSFKQIGDFCDLHELEVQGIADGDVAVGVKGFDPIANNQLTADEIATAEKNPLHKMKLKFNASAVGEEKRRGPRYTPLSKRQDRPASILWLVKFHPELSDAQISKLIGTTKPTIQAIRERTHWNIQNIQPIDPVALGLCKQSELDTIVQKAAAKKAAEGGIMTDEERRKLVSTEQSLGMDPEENKLPSNMSGLETFSLSGNSDEEDPPRDRRDVRDADSFFNLPDSDEDDEDDDGDTKKKKKR
ncbi:MAG: cell cycle transcriptional regulator TrcR [Jannaschia sp.]